MVFSLGAIVILVSFLFFLVGCSKEDNTASSSESTNKLTFGTGLSSCGCALVGEASEFQFSSLPGSDTLKMLWFRLACEKEMGGNDVALEFSEVQIDGSLKYVRTDTFKQPQNYGRICMANFYLSRRAKYSVMGKLMSSRPTTVATAPLTLK
jgi:hypothetical protein